MSEQPHPLQHPSRVWNAIETRINRILSLLLPEKALRWCWGGLQLLVAMPLAVFVLQDTLATAFFHIAIADHLCSERIITCVPAEVHAENEGRLIKIQGRLEHAGPAIDPILGVHIHAPCARRDFDMNPEGIHSLNTESSALHALVTARSTLTAERVTIGDYRIRHAETPLFEHYNAAIQPAAKRDITLGTPAKGLTVTMEDTPAPAARFLIHTEDGVLLGTATYDIPQEKSRRLFIIGRQENGTLDMRHEETDYYTSPFARFNKDRRTEIGLEPGDFVFFIPVIFILLLLLYMLLGTLRAAWWNLTRKADILRLPLWQATLLLGCSGSFLLAGAAIFLLKEIADEPFDHITVPGMLFIVVGLGILACTAQQWRLKRTNA